MAIYRVGTFTATASGTAQNLNLGFLPDVLRIWQQSDWPAAGNALSDAAPTYFEYFSNMLAGTVLSYVYTTGAPVVTYSANGVTPFQSTDPNLWTPQQVPYTSIAGNRQYIQQSTNLVITGLSNAAQASVTATHSFTTSDIGVTVVTFHGVLGMTQINGLQGVVTGVTSNTSFTVNINTTNFGTYSAGVAGVTGGFANVITGAPVDTLYSNALLPTAQANLGIIGVTLGTTIIDTAGDSYFYEAIAQSPVTGP